MTDRQIREDVINAIAAVAYDAMKTGLDGFDLQIHIEEKFPGTPYSVVWEAVTRAEIQCDEEWWQQIEATIDGEAVRRAVVAIHDREGGQ